MAPSPAMVTVTVTERGLRGRLTNRPGGYVLAVSDGWQSVEDDDAVVYSKRANRTVGRRAVGGRLVITNSSIGFVPSRAETHPSALLDVSIPETWATAIDNVDDVSLAPRRFRALNFFSGEWRTGIWISPRTGVGQRFTVPRPSRALVEIRDALWNESD